MADRITVAINAYQANRVRFERFVLDGGACGDFFFVLLFYFYQLRLWGESYFN